MAEALGVAGSIAGLYALLTYLVSTTHDIKSALKSKPKELVELSSHLNALHAIVGELRYTGSSPEIEMVLVLLEDVLRGLEVKVTRLLRGNEVKGTGKAVIASGVSAVAGEAAARRVVMAWKKEEIMEVVRTLECLKTTLMLALQTSQRKATASQTSTLESVLIVLRQLLAETQSINVTLASRQQVIQCSGTCKRPFRAVLPNRSFEQFDDMEFALAQRASARSSRAADPYADPYFFFS